MKKTIFIQLILLAFLLPSYSQKTPTEYFPTGTFWVEVTTNTFDSFYYRPDLYHIDTDTIINNKRYKKVLLNDNLYTALREANDKVYLHSFEEKTDRLLYDFSWSIGKELYYQPYWSDEEIVFMKISAIKQIRLRDGNLYDYCEEQVDLQ